MKVAAIGGGHGTAVTLRALRLMGCDVTAIVSVADDGGSSGALRESLGIAGVGDVRKCLAALAGNDKPWSEFFEFRFADETVGAHALGNLFLAAAIGSTLTLEDAVASVANLIDARGSVIPASREGVQLEAETHDGTIVGQVAIGQRHDVERIRTIPSEIRAPESAISAILQADFVLLGPGSLFTSVLAACVVPGIAEAIARSKAKCVWISNLVEQDPETKGLGLQRQYEAMLKHGLEIDIILVNSVDGLVGETPEITVITADVAGRNRRVHDPEKLSRVLTEIMAN